MRWFHQLVMRIQMLFRRGRKSLPCRTNCSCHLDQHIAENIEAGMTPTEARFAALRMFGNPTLLRDQTRDTWSWGNLELLLHDLRHGIRTLTRTPGFCFLAILVMALGIGANVALFTVVNPSCSTLSPSKTSTSSSASTRPTPMAPIATSSSMEALCHLAGTSP